MDLSKCKDLLLKSDSGFWNSLALLTSQATEFDDLLFLSTLRRKAQARLLPRPTPAIATIRLAIVGGTSLYPLHDLLCHLLEAAGYRVELFLGDYDNYVSEIMSPDSGLYAFAPNIVLVLPGAQRCRYEGAITDDTATVQQAVDATADQLLSLCTTINERTKAEVLLCNFILPGRFDPGEYRSRSLASDWSFRKAVNQRLGLNAPSCVRICDLEFLSCRRGLLNSENPRGWFESKQPCSASLLVDLCKEAFGLIRSLRSPMKKVLVLDLDNTLWGGVVADDGMEGIEIGDTSPRGEAFKAFQKYIATLRQRGVLLAVCSKNDHDKAIEPFKKHPEMVLREADFVSFKANWDPKSDNIRKIADELNLGIDSLVFVDDNPAEIEIVRQFVPAVTCIQLSADPSEYVGQLQDSRLFEPRNITAEDSQRTAQYRAEGERKSILSSATDMDSYLASLDMQALIHAFAPIDVPRISQLINKSNQFNLTTRRRSEAEVQELIGQSDHVTLSGRLTDRFGDHGLISVVIGRAEGKCMHIDTWLMSCRVLKRQVEETMLNELCRRAKEKGCEKLKGVYLATAKNDMVKDFYPRMGFESKSVTAERGEYELDLISYIPRPTKITLKDSL